MAANDSRKKISWNLDILPRATKNALDFLSRQSWLKRSRWYLAGGTAMAMQAGHRKSVDLDFFLPSASFHESILAERFDASVWKTDFIEPGTVYGRLKRAKTSFIANPFFKPKKKFKYYGNVRVLDIDDIAVMKIIAISQRGRKRDFFDLYWYVNNREPLLDVVKRLPRQYPSVAHGYHHILKSLTYFADADNDPDPVLNFSATWTGVKRFFRSEVPKIAREVMGLQ